MNKLILTVFLISSLLICQENDDSKSSTILLSINHTAQMPFGDLSDRFGLNSNVGLTLTYQTATNFIINLESGLLFGSDVKENDIFNAINGDDGDILSTSGEIPTIRLFERGGYFDVSFGKYIKLNNKKHESGIVMTLGAGYLYHKIFIETIVTALPQLNNELLKGYDRLSGGILTKQFIGYYFFSSTSTIRFFLGLEAMQGFTKDLRGYNYTTQTYVTNNRIDQLVGIKCGFIIPIKKRRTGKYYYY
ncbi:MAG: hypothetical protein CMD26_05985 [Flavobacteriales bacterium]|nr:hypothetical protein [Flavobacteriales bacterium]|tara:strand:+ start:16239 stop:16982 length:744 start_codon:yes stop_codon:yes gene_type:complete